MTGGLQERLRREEALRERMERVDRALRSLTASDFFRFPLSGWLRVREPWRRAYARERRRLGLAPDKLSRPVGGRTQESLDRIFGSEEAAA